MSAITSLPFTCPGPGTYELTGNFSQPFTERAIQVVSGVKLNLGPYSIVNTSGDSANQLECVGGYNLSDVEIVGGGENMGSGFMYGLHLPHQTGVGGQNIVIRDGQWNGVLLRAIRAASANGRLENVTVRNTGGTTSGITIPMAFECLGNWTRKNLTVENVFANDPNEELVAFSISQGAGARTQSYNENLRCVNEGAAKPKSIAFWTCSDTQQPVDVIDGLESVGFGRVLWLGSDTPPYHPYSFRRGVVGVGHTLAHKILNPSKAVLIGAPDLMVAADEPPASLVDLLPVMTAQTTAGVTITGNSIGGGQYDAWHVADGGVSSYVQWNQNGGGYCDVELPVAAILKSYQLGARVDNYGQQYAPKTWVVRAWNGSDWVSVDTQINAPSWNAGEVRTYSCTSPISTTKYRVDVSASQGGTYLQWRCLKMWE